MLAGGRDALRGQLPAGCRIPTPGGLVARTDRATENKEAGHGGRLSAFQTASDLRRWVLRAGCSLLFCGRMPLFAGRMPASFLRQDAASFLLRQDAAFLFPASLDPFRRPPVTPRTIPPHPPLTADSPPTQHRLNAASTPTRRPSPPPRPLAQLPSRSLRGGDHLGLKPGRLAQATIGHQPSHVAKQAATFCRDAVPVEPDRRCRRAVERDRQLSAG